MRRVVQQTPYNAETPTEAFAEPLTPREAFFVRCHFGIPVVDPAGWRLRVGGAVRQPLELSLDELRALGAHELIVTLECAGNGRSLLRPVPPGVPWGVGAVGTARFTGTPLRNVLDRAGLQPDAVEVAFFGADAGEVESGRVEPFARSLPLDVATGPDVLLAWGMNGAPLLPEHGFPLRLVVPGWYGMASVKWLTRVEVLPEPFAGHFQRQDYVYRYADGRAEPVTRVRVRSLILHPPDGARIASGPVEVRGLAWSGFGPIRRVEVSTDGGRSWREADLEEVASPYAAVRWRFRWVPRETGAYTLVSRATDTAGNAQPLEPLWNQRGYGNNACPTICVTVGASDDL